ncbi:MAG: hypothetical protein HWE23_13480 [Rhodobacteraceae bacterium]|nr:hypothetical protein [Paracoccaceae bacterium]
MPELLSDPFTHHADNAAKPFAVGFSRSSGEALVGGGIFFGLALIGLAALTDTPILNAASLIPIAVALWHYPMVERKDPQLGANAEGVFIERLGFLDWASIQKFSISKTAVRSIELATLEITLSSSLEDAISKPHAFKAWKRLMIKNWRAYEQEDGTTLLVVKLHTLRVDPEEILQRLRAYRNV